MKALRLTAWIAIALSLIFKLLHYPFNGPLIVLGALLLFIHAIIFLIKNIKTNIADAFFHLNISLWTTYTMFRFMFWPFSKFIFIICVCLTSFYSYTFLPQQFYPTRLLIISIIFSISIPL